MPAEKVSLALLINAAFGRAAGLRYAKLVGLSAILIDEVFRRPGKEVRKDVLSISLVDDRCTQSRE